MERAVETNQKHLIKKILARYPAQWTFFRELIQNSDDAQASQAVIEFTTTKSSNRVVHTTVSNNGKVFSPADWSRLCSIASGNPDPEKVGFFGVGFYSVFALSDSPTVLSGKVSLEFFWKGNALFTRETARNASDDKDAVDDGWTRFLLPKPESAGVVVDGGGDAASSSATAGSPLPDFNEIGQFLCELLCFSRNLRTVKVLCNGQLRITAKRDDVALTSDDQSAAVALPFPASLAAAASSPSLSSLLSSTFSAFNNSISSSTSSSSSSRVRFSPAVPAPALSQSVISLSVVNTSTATKTASTPTTTTTFESISLVRASAKFAALVSPHCARQYLEMTQKQHPAQVDVSILLSLERPHSNDQKPSSSSLLSKINPRQCRGRVFVGFVTSQTTGMGAHVSGPFIPTMEREHLDFSNEMAKTWNLALFLAAGWLGRVVHDSICTSPRLFAPLDKSAPPPPPPAQTTDEQDSFWGSMRRMVHSALVVVGSSVGGGDDDDAAARGEDLALFASLEHDTGAIVVSSMACFCPIVSECRPHTGVVQALWSGFVTQFEGASEGPLVWTCQGRAMSCDKVRLFPTSTATTGKLRLPPLSSIETFPVVASQLSRPVVDAASRSTACLVSTLLHQLVTSKRMYYFELQDIVVELKTRPLRGVDETCGVLAWLGETMRDNATQATTTRKLTLRCSNCSSQFTTTASSTASTTSCPSCYCRLTLPAAPAPGTVAGLTPADEQLVRALWQHASCELEPGTTATTAGQQQQQRHRFSQWRFVLDPALEPHLGLVYESAPQLQQELCPVAISAKCAPPASLVQRLTWEVWMRRVFGAAQQPQQQLSADMAFKLLYLVCFPMHATKQQQTDVLKTLECIPAAAASTSTSVVLALPQSVYTAEIEEEKDALVLAKLPGDAIIPAQHHVAFLRFLLALGVRESVSPVAMVKLFLKGALSRPALWAFIRELVVERKSSNNNAQLEPALVPLLTASKCVARIGHQEGLLFLPGELLLPSPDLVELSSVLPVLLLDEPALEPFFANELRVPKTPSNSALLDVASGAVPIKLRLKALRLLYANNAARGSSSQFFAACTQPILPCLPAPNGKTAAGGEWRAPSQCFLRVPPHLASSCATCDEAALLQAGFVDCKQQLAVAAFPPIQLSIDYLTRVTTTSTTSPPTTTTSTTMTATIDGVLDYLVEMQSHISETEFAQLQRLRLVPVPPTCLLLQKQALFQVSTQCYFANGEDGDDGDNTAGGGDGALASLFCFVSEARWKKTPQHKYLYQRLGVRQAPTLNEVALSLATRPQPTLDAIGPVEYQNILRVIAAEAGKMKREVLQAMQQSPCLIGLYTPPNNSSATLGLFAARQIVIEDDSRYRRLFAAVPSCPTNDTALERLYLALGSSNISAVVEETSRPIVSEGTGALPLSQAAIALDEQLSNRLPVLTQKSNAADLIKDRVDAWGLRAKNKRLSRDFGQPGTSLVRQVSGIRCELRLKLKSSSSSSGEQVAAVMHSTCCIYQDQLCVTKVDYFHVASALVGALLRVRSNDRAFLWASLLQSSDASLEEMGFVLPKEPPPLPPALAATATALPPPKPMRFGGEEDHHPVKPAATAALGPSLAGSSDKPAAPPPPPPPPVPVKASAPPPPQLPRPAPLPPPTGASSSAGSTLPQLPTTSFKPPLPPLPMLPAPSSSTTTNSHPPAAHPPPPAGKLVPPNMDRFRDSAIDTALQKCRACEHSSIVDDGKPRLADAPPIRDAMLDCTQPHDLVRDVHGLGSIECFVPRELLQQQQGHATTSPFEMYMAQGREFANLLLQMSVEVFQLDPNVLHLFFDPRGITRAFNLNGALFFNLYCFVHDGDSLKLAKSWKRWFGTFCHELSHNCWKAHDAQFANFIEVFCVEFADSLHSCLRLRGLM